MVIFPRRSIHIKFCSKRAHRTELRRTLHWPWPRPLTDTVWIIWIQRQATVTILTLVLSSNTQILMHHNVCCLTHRRPVGDWTESYSLSGWVHLKKEKITPCLLCIQLNENPATQISLHYTCNDHRGPLCGLLPLLDPVLIHLVFYLLEFVHGIQTVSPPLLLHCFAQLGLVRKLLSRLHNLLLQGKSALQVSQEGILHKTQASTSPERRNK